MTYNRENAGVVALKFAREMTGRPYVYGGTWPESGGTDCSGMVEWAYEQVGVALPRTTYQQYLVHQIPKNVENEPGDLLFIAGSDAIGSAPGHVMMFVEDGQVFQAPFTGEKIGQYPYDTAVFEYRTRPALVLPSGTPATKHPSTQQVTKAGLVVLANPAQAHCARENGWSLYVWDGRKFVGAQGVQAKDTPEYANKNFRRKRIK